MHTNTATAQASRLTYGDVASALKVTASSRFFSHYFKRLTVCKQKLKNQLYWESICIEIYDMCFSF